MNSCWVKATAPRKRWRRFSGRIKFEWGRGRGRGRGRGKEGQGKGKIGKGGRDFKTDRQTDRKIERKMKRERQEGAVGMVDV